jgi:hypothetical protein
LFRIHRRGRDLFVGRSPLPCVEAWLAANRSRFKPGEVTKVVIEHDECCLYPQDGPCKCKNGLEIRIKGEKPPTIHRR